jgi:hypothetical protein
MHDSLPPTDLFEERPAHLRTDRRTSIAVNDYGKDCTARERQAAARIAAHPDVLRSIPEFHIEQSLELPPRHLQAHLADILLGGLSPICLAMLGFGDPPVNLDILFLKTFGLRLLVRKTDD